MTLPGLFPGPHRCTFSPCRLYRYTWERGAPDLPALVMVMLNPSTADEQAMDPTVTRCWTRAEALGRRLVVVNLFALRSTDPRGLREVADPVGPDNDAAILGTALEPGALVCCAWGAHPMTRGRAGEVVEALRGAGVTLHALAWTKGGAPRHPLYLRGDCVLEVWE